MDLRASDIELVRAAASLAAHAPERMVAAHLASKLEDLARRLELAFGRESEGESHRAIDLPRAA
jgi:hypothetical protein